MLRTILSVSFLFTILTITPFESFAGEESVYDFSWLDKDKEVYVLQNRKYRKAGRPFVSIGTGVTTSGAFVDSYYYQGRLGFFFKEDFGFEGIYTKSNGSENDTFKDIPSSTAFIRTVDNYWGAGILWSPFYAKVNTFNKVIYVDWTIGAGFGQLTEKNNKETLVAGVAMPLTTETHPAVYWDMQLKFWVNTNWTVNFDIISFYYEADKAKADSGSNPSEYYSNYDLGLSLSYNF